MAYLLCAGAFYAVIGDWRALIGCIRRLGALGDPQGTGLLLRRNWMPLPALVTLTITSTQHNTHGHGERAATALRHNDYNYHR